MNQKFCNILVCTSLQHIYITQWAHKQTFGFKGGFKASSQAKSRLYKTFQNGLVFALTPNMDSVMSI